MELNFNPVFIGGAGRSGTTLLRVMLNAHPNICAGPEFKILNDFIDIYGYMQSSRFQNIADSYLLDNDKINSIYAHFITDLFSPFIENSNGKRLIEKTPHNVLIMNELGEIFPNAKFIHVVRDGRDVAKSLCERDWVDSNGNRFWYVENIRNAATYWGQAVSKGILSAQSPHIINRVKLVRYEDLIEQPETVMRDVLDFLEEPWSDMVLKHYEKKLNEPKESSTEQAAKPIYSDKKYRWKQEYTKQDALDFHQANVFEILYFLGYETNPNWFEQF